MATTSGTTFYVGTSGYADLAWKGSFYPQDLPAKGMLRYYGVQFRAVELNNTFYRMPKAPALAALTKEVPGDFRCALKAPQSITHFRRLKNVDEPLAAFVGAARVLKTRLGPVLFQ